MARQPIERPVVRVLAGSRRRPKPRSAGRRAWNVPALRAPRLDARSQRIALGCAVLVLAMGAGWWLYRSPVFSLHGVAVDGNSVLSDETVRLVAGLDDERLIGPDLEGARERLEAVPLIREAEVTRDWPFGAHITVVERVPWGVWQIGDQRYVIDSEGFVLTLPEPQDAPLILRTDAAAPLRPGDRVDVGAVDVASRLVATAEQTLGRPVARLEFSQSAGLTAVLSDGLRVSFGDASDYDYKLAALFAVLERAQAQGMSVQHVDLRFGDKVAVQ